MSVKNSLENKKKRRENKASKKALKAVLDTLASTPEERGDASGLVVAKSVLWTPEEGR